jgi:DNA-binding GntR family transcriptional regulator
MTYPADINIDSGGKVVRVKAKSPASPVKAKVPSADQPVEPDDDVTMTERAYRQIEELIVTLQLPPGMVLSEQMLAQRLDIGRTPIREALQRLARDGLVLILPRRGILVSEINVRTQLRLLEVRRELERLLARLAAERATPAERAEFDEIAAGMLAASEAADDMAFVRLDLQFNNLVSQAARNEFATRSMALMHGLSRRFWYQHYKEVADLPLAAKLHAEVAQAIARRDTAAAAAASDRLIDYIQDFARKTVEA